MQVRVPNFDFTGMTPHWAPNIEVVQAVNAIGIIPAYIEPFLIKVMRRAVEQLDPVADAELLRDIDLFNKQEGQHYKLHRAFNAMIRTSYPDMTRYEKAYEEDYERFLQTKSLRWLLAYCEGFESIGSSTAQLWVDGQMESKLGAEPSPAIDLWKWHLAEEYEHRTVAHRVYHRLYGEPRIAAWLYRIRGVVICARHMGQRTSALRDYLLRADRERMTEQQRRESQQRERAATKATNRENLRLLAHAFSPFYDPAELPPPSNIAEVLARYPARTA